MAQEEINFNCTKENLGSVLGKLRKSELIVHIPAAHSP